jgi:hypothetical protein
MSYDPILFTGSITGSGVETINTGIASSVNLPGNPTTTTQGVTTNSTVIATTAFVQASNSSSGMVEYSFFGGV